MSEIHRRSSRKARVSCPYCRQRRSRPTLSAAEGYVRNESDPRNSGAAVGPGHVKRWLTKARSMRQSQFQTGKTGGIRRPIVLIFRVAEIGGIALVPAVPSVREILFS